MLSVKTLIVSIVLSSVAVVSFAQAPHAPKKSGSVAKPLHQKMKPHAKKSLKIRKNVRKSQHSQVVHGKNSAAPGLQAY